MGTPRPTIIVENLDLDIRPWPNNENGTYCHGRRFCFRLGPCDGYWQWPWPEWIGLPERGNVKEWFNLLDGWKLILMNPEERSRIEDYVKKLMPYI